MNKKIILILCIMSLAGCAEIDKALYDISSSVSSQDRITGIRSLNITDRAKQIEKGNALSQNLVKEEYLDKDLKVDKELDEQEYNRLLNIFNKVHQVSHMRDEKWTLHLIPEKTFNAFVVGRADVFVNQGLLQEVKSDDEIAAILGHEIAHISANHAYEKMSMKILSKISSNEDLQRDAGSAAYTHENEEEADRIGILYVALAGYDPYAANEIWTRMYKKYGNSQSLFFDHPLNEERAQTTKKIADKVNAYYIKGEQNPDFEAILLDNTIYQTYADEGFACIV